MTFLAVLLTAALLVPGGVPSESAAGPVVPTDKGAVQGIRDDGVDSFLGLRYAAPPTGDLRWRPPQPASPWGGVRLATAYGNRCAAAASTNGPRSESEDCLFVNVQRPAGVGAGARRPVYVFIHGGGLINGSSNQADMAAIVRQTGAIGVTFNYRLGVLGFLGLAGLPDSGNYGFQDQQAALGWIQRNIAAFGGDPRQVTVGGESAGGWSVCGHLVAPGSRGLFARAMIQSGSCVTRTVEQASEAGATTAAEVGCGDPATAVACLRNTPVGKLIDAPDQVVYLTRGTATLPADPASAVAAGDFARVPVVIGSNRDEGRTFAQGYIAGDRASYENYVTSTFGSRAGAVLKHYPWPAHAGRFTAAYLIGAIMTDDGRVGGIGGCPGRRLTRDLARWTTTYAYQFDHRTGPGLTPIPGYAWGAGHAAELAYLFPRFDNGTPIAPTFDAAERRLARRMKTSWGEFTFLGTPGWPSYNRSRAFYSLWAGRAVPDAVFAAEHQCSFWGAG